MNRSLVVASLLASLALPATAGASTVTGTAHPGIPSWTDAVFVGGSGVNDVTLTSFPAYTWTDAAQALTAQGLCVQSTPVTCGPGPAVVQLGGGDDRLTNTGYSLDLSVTGGSGEDTITANGNTTVVHGNDGEDTIDVRANGAPVAYGDDDDDHLRGAYPNGLGSRLYGGYGNDLLVGNSLWGDDRMDGGPDDDQIFAILAGGQATGGNGNDTIVDIAANGYGSHLTVSGGAGADTIVGGDATDTVDAGGGADVIDVGGDSGSHVDSVICGSGHDIVWADAGDTVAADCEDVRSGPAPDLGAVDAAVAHLKETYPTSPTGIY
jgi:Ca2+-binding RTX toxin-like protein